MFNVTYLGNGVAPLTEMRITFSQSVCMDLWNTGVHSNQSWREKILQCKSEEVCIILIAAKERWVICQPQNLKEKSLKLDCFPTVPCTVERHLQKEDREKSMVSTGHSSISALTRAHLKRLSHLCHTIFYGNVIIFNNSLKMLSRAFITYSFYLFLCTV